MDQDRDPTETREWLDALNSVEAFEGVGRVDELLEGVIQAARRKGAKLSFAANTAYVNTIPPHDEPTHPGDRVLEHKIRSIIRWNAAAIVLRANKTSSELGGHIASFQSAATLYDTGFMHFWHAPTEAHGGDLIYYQGHCSPGIYARAFLEGRLSEEQLLNFRQEVDGKGLSSYPHPWLLPDFWQFPTVSMGLGPLMAIYQARFLKYLDCRGLADTKPRKVWAFMGDGEMDEPKSLGAISLGGREHLDNLVFVINCNLTVKGYGMGESGEGQMISHQAKKMNEEALRQFRDRFQIPVSDEALKEVPFVRLAADSPEMKYLAERRAALGGHLPARRRKSASIKIPPLSAFAPQLKSTEGREISTTMAFVRILNTLLRDKEIGKRIVPIVPDESRTFGMEGMFRQFGIFSQVGQLYRPQDADQMMFYREDKTGQILQEGINEAGAMASWIAAATSYSTSDTPVIPFYIYYSMFGFQRVGDLAWAAGDMRARGFLIGGTSGRTTLNGEGLQHEDGHSHLIAATIPNCVCYDPTYSYELAVIIQDGLRRMYGENEDVFYYITTLNENYPHGEMPEGAEEGIRKGMYKLRSVEAKKKAARVQLLGSGAILREVEAGAALLADDFGIASDIWSVTSFMELRRDGLDADRWNMLHPTAAPKRSHVETCLDKAGGPVIASTDYMKLLADQIRPFVPGRYRVLGTDGFGRSDYRRKLRSFFEVDRFHVVVAALKALSEEGAVPASVVADALRKYGIDPDRPNPTTV